MELMTAQDETYPSASDQMNARCGEKDGCGATKRADRIEKRRGEGCWEVV